MSLKSTIAQLESFDAVKDYLVLDGGTCKVLVLTRVFSVYTPEEGFTELTRDEAEALSMRYWHHHGFRDMCEAHNV